MPSRYGYVRLEAFRIRQEGTSVIAVESLQAQDAWKRACDEYAAHSKDVEAYLLRREDLYAELISSSSSIVNAPNNIFQGWPGLR